MITCGLCGADVDLRDLAAHYSTPGLCRKFVVNVNEDAAKARQRALVETVTATLRNQLHAGFTHREFSIVLVKRYEPGSDEYIERDSDEETELLTVIARNVVQALG